MTQRRRLLQTIAVTKEARELAEDLGVKIFTADIIYHLFDQFTAYLKKVRGRRAGRWAEKAGRAGGRACNGGRGEPPIHWNILEAACHSETSLPAPARPSSVPRDRLQKMV